MSVNIHRGLRLLISSKRAFKSLPSVPSLILHNQRSFVPTRALSSSTAHFQSNEDNKPALSKKEQLKLAVRDYGSTVIVFHVGISLVSLGGFYTAVSSGLDVVLFVSQIPYIGESIVDSQFGGGATTFVVAYAVHKVFAPVRISITLTSTPFIVRYLRERGVLKAKKKEGTE